MNRLFVGGLPEDASRSELEKEFEYFGRVRDVWVAKNPPGFGFVSFEDRRDADDAMKGMDGKHVCGSRIRVEYARGPKRGGRGGRGGFNTGRYGHSSREFRGGRYGGRGGGGGGGGGGGYGRRRSRSRSRSFERDRQRRRSRSRSRSHSRDRDRRSKSRSQSRDNSKERYSRSPERIEKRSRSRSRSNSREAGQSREVGIERRDINHHGRSGDDN